MICGCDFIDTFQKRITSPAFAHFHRFTESLVIRKLGWFSSRVGGKNELWGLRQSSSVLLRSQAAPGSRSLLWRVQNLSGVRDSACAMSELRPGEAGTTVLAGRQSVLHQALRFLHRSTLPGFDHSRCCQGTASGLEDRQRTGKTIHARAVAQGGRAWAKNHWD